MGGDFAPLANLGGAFKARKELNESVTLVLIGDEVSINSCFEQNNQSLDGFEIVHSSEVITMSDHPTRALTKKPNSSISIGFDMLASGELDAFASTGNTGAMLVGSIYKINTIPGIIRPCITSVLPQVSGKTSIILDVGAIADCKPDILYQFAILGSVYAKNVLHIENPRIALLNIGEEPEKGNLLTQATHKLMKGTADFNFIGNIESRDLFTDKADVFVCDGFTGNVILKQAEGIFTIMSQKQIKDDYIEKFNYENYGGTPVLGINSNVIIGHGISNDNAVYNMIMHSYNCVESGLSSQIKAALNHE
jgi:glycerol-3-phosphate acyltransferase PlsX